VTALSYGGPLQRQSASGHSVPSGDGVVEPPLLTATSSDGTPPVAASPSATKRLQSQIQ